MNRAICKIYLDSNFRERRPSSEGNRTQIIKDLKTASSDEALAQRIKKIEEIEPIQTWLELNPGSSLGD